MKNFDEKREARKAEDRTFQIGGETFTRKTGVRPEVLAEYEKVGADTPASEVLKVVDDLVLQMVEHGANGDVEAMWKALRERDDDPVTLGDLLELVAWLIETDTGQTPTPPRSPSSGGRGSTKRLSTADSS